MSEEEFFERLRERTIHKLLIQEGYDPVEDADVFEPHPDGWKGDVEEVDATIEALKEMMVGEPKRMFRISHHTKPDGEEWTFVRHFSSEHISLDGHHGTDGEEVVVMVFKDAS